MEADSPQGAAAAAAQRGVILRLTLCPQVNTRELSRPQVNTSELSRSRRNGALHLGTGAVRLLFPLDSLGYGPYDTTIIGVLRGRGRGAVPLSAGPLIALGPTIIPGHES